MWWKICKLDNQTALLIAGCHCSQLGAIQSVCFTTMTLQNVMIIRTYKILGGELQIIWLLQCDGSNLEFVTVIVPALPQTPYTHLTFVSWKSTTDFLWNISESRCAGNYPKCLTCMWFVAILLCIASSACQVLILTGWFLSVIFCAAINHWHHLPLTAPSNVFLF